MVKRPIFYLLAGPNGAGKSTLYKSLVADGLIDQTAEFINADLYEAAHLQHIQNPETRSIMARDWADQRRSALLSEGISFASETVFSHVSKLTLIEQAAKQGFYVSLLIVGLDDSKRLLDRVKQRVKEGGHSVPDERILARYPRTLTNLKLAIPIAHMALLYDSDDARHAGHELVAICQDGQLIQQAPSLPQWVKTILNI
jgi:predicted ABC-type ATPase